MPAPPIATGTLLQDRYRIVGVAGQGHFGQTYLARDQQHLNALCVLKEFLPGIQDPAVLQTLEQQFTQRARVLSALKHAQVPSYQYLLRENQRFYWVREYIEGKSYGVLLDERKAQGQTFSEQEVVQFLLRILPVLHYLHSQTVIHRNLSLDSLIVRQADQLPVLISFGLVTELVAQLHLHPLDDRSEIHGRWGFAPPEQFQSGQVFPHSDLYALGMTAIALLSGQEPEDLYNESEHVINWEPWVTVNPELRQILRRLLQPDPQQRLSSAAEVLQALQVMIRGGAPLSMTPAHFPAGAAAAVPATGTAAFAAGAAAMAAAQAAVAVGTAPEPATAGPSTPLVTTTADEPSVPPSTAAAGPTAVTVVSPRNGMAPAVPQGILTKRATVKPGAAGTPSAAAGGRSDRRIDLASLFLLLGFLLLLSVVSWRVFSFLKTQQDTAAPPGGGAPATVQGERPSGSASAPASPGAAPPSAAPAAQSAADERSTQEAMRLRRRNLGIDYRFLADFVDEVFYAKHPEWRGKKLDASTDQDKMRQEWLAIATTTMDKLATLPPELRRKLGTYKPVNYQGWLLDLGEVGPSSPTLDALADQRLVELFPDLKGQPSNPKTTGQVWYALAETQLPQAKRQKSPAKP